MLDSRATVMPALLNVSLQSRWVAEQLSRAQEGFMDGINFDLEDAAKVRSAASIILSFGSRVSGY